MATYIWSDIEQQPDGKWKARWGVGTNIGQGTFDTKEEAEEYVRRSINRATGFSN
jgi:hypothetical protein